MIEEKQWKRNTIFAPVSFRETSWDSVSAFLVSGNETLVFRGPFHAPFQLSRVQFPSLRFLGAFGSRWLWR